MKQILFYLTLLLAISSCVSTTSTDESAKAIVKVLMDQEDAWNKADLETYLNGYWDDDRLRFIAPHSISYGLDEVREMYQRGYKTPADFGELQFELQEIDLLSVDAAAVVGSYKLTYEDRKDRKGNFTLIFKKIGDEWKIIQDHSS